MTTWKETIRRFIKEAMTTHSLVGTEIEDAVAQAAFQSVGYTERRVLQEAQRRMEPTRYAELERVVTERIDSRQPPAAG